MLVIPPVSDRGATRPRGETSSIYPHAPKKTWFAVYTAPRHEKFVQTQLTAKADSVFPALIYGRKALEERGSASDRAPRVSGLCFCLPGGQRTASGTSNRRRRLFCGERHRAFAARRSRDPRDAYRRRTRVAYASPFPGRGRYCLHHTRTIPGRQGSCGAAWERSDVCRDHPIDPAVLCDPRQADDLELAS